MTYIRAGLYLISVLWAFGAFYLHDEGLTTFLVFMAGSVGYGLFSFAERLKETE